MISVLGRIMLVFLNMWSVVFSQTHPTSNFSNPLLSTGADPWSIYQGGYYYYMNTFPDSVVLWKTSNLAELKNGQRKTIWIPPSGTMYSKELWAPEIHLINGIWYVYFAADNGDNNNHRVYVLENKSFDPMKGTWVFKGKIAAAADYWAIDASVFEYHHQLYMVWSGWETNKNGRQDIYIGKMKNPWTMEGDRVRISSPMYSWEKFGDLSDRDNPAHVDVNEGPQILIRNDHLFLVYSASGCWTDHYSLGMLSAKGGSNLLDSSSWDKSPLPVFSKSVKNGVYAPGHNSFFRSPDGKEDWILYHANAAPGQGCGNHRSPRGQKFSWNKDGSPNFGEPVRTGTLIPIPGESKKAKLFLKSSRKRAIQHEH